MKLKYEHQLTSALQDKGMMIFIFDCGIYRGDIIFSRDSKRENIVLQKEENHHGLR